MRERVTASGVLRACAVAVVGAAVATTFQTWTVALGSDDLLRGHSMWTSGVGGAVAAVVFLLGTALVAASGLDDSQAGTARAGLALFGAIGALTGTGGLLFVRYSGGRGLTAQIASYDLDPTLNRALVFTPPAGCAFLLVVGAAALALAIVTVARRPAPLPPEQRRVALGVVLPLIVGVIAVVVGSIALSWSPAVQLVSVPLWKSGATAVTGGLLVVSGAFATVAAVMAATAPGRRPVFAAAATGLSAVGTALLIADRVSAAGQHRATRASTDLNIPPYVVTTGVVVVIVGAGLVLAAAVTATCLLPVARPATLPARERVSAL